ncbi:MAG: bifunctional phosphoribosyl-AMP cyclohydrolase/phosphoribosyl-ATP diphosphatase HisIE [Flavobacteriales bacterium]|nr:bifunctional phosphoribosyl-AMP cyclohydrolase/phosphoribosyl-ATP diphosphatase HisIE [Flavobacteriales bacterium]MCB9449768.1 bifunctional phosphoribosyl-AMP cyclohydrolase/phosphoribosyl-ATP diphosphatase HisIE [Flavobacteriales bacterium]
MKPDFQKMNGLIPAVVQDDRTGRVLMVGFMNEEAFAKTQSDKKVTFFSRTKNRLWTKGEESGNFLLVKNILIDCDEDTVLIKAEPTGPVCHTGADTCFNETNRSIDFLSHLEEVIRNRKEHPDEKSYTASLFKKGINKVAQKVGEEATELVIEAMDRNDDLFLEEAADLLFHYIVLLRAKDKSLGDVVGVLEGRHK